MTLVIAIVGPTAIGKTNLAIQLSQRLKGEIVSADSRQIYRYMDIGTAKPTTEERETVRHHLIDIINPNEEYSLALYQRDALEAINGIQRRRKQAFLVGGSGLYVWGLLEGWRIPAVVPNKRLRHQLEVRVRSEGVERLYQELIHCDPVAAQSIDPRNVRRVIRALEVCGEDQKFSELSRKEPFFDFSVIGLTVDRACLYKRIDQRVDRMMANGFVNEVKSLYARGYTFDLPSMSGIGYRQIGKYLNGEYDLDTAVEKIKTETHRFARRQYSWFSLKDRRIQWFNTEENYVCAISEYLSRQGLVESIGKGGRNGQDT